MLAILPELEQYVQCRALECQLEQQSVEFEQQCRVPLRLQYLKLRNIEIVELQGWFLSCIMQNQQDMLFW